MNNTKFCFLLIVVVILIGVFCYLNFYSGFELGANAQQSPVEPSKLITVDNNVVKATYQGLIFDETDLNNRTGGGDAPSNVVLDLRAYKINSKNYLLALIGGGHKLRLMVYNNDNPLKPTLIKDFLVNEIPKSIQQVPLFSYGSLRIVDNYRYLIISNSGGGSYLLDFKNGNDISLVKKLDLIGDIFSVFKIGAKYYIARTPDLNKVSSITYPNNDPIKDAHYPLPPDANGNYGGYLFTNPVLFYEINNDFTFSENNLVSGWRITHDPYYPSGAISLMGWDFHRITNFPDMNYKDPIVMFTKAGKPYLAISASYSRGGILRFYQSGMVVLDVTNIKDPIPVSANFFADAQSQFGGTEFPDYVFNYAGDLSGGDHGEKNEWLERDGRLVSNDNELIFDPLSDWVINTYRILGGETGWTQTNYPEKFGQSHSVIFRNRCIIIGAKTSAGSKTPSKNSGLLSIFGDISAKGILYEFAEPYNVGGDVDFYDGWENSLGGGVYHFPQAGRDPMVAKYGEEDCIMGRNIITTHYGVVVTQAGYVVSFVKNGSLYEPRVSKTKDEFMKFFGNTKNTTYGKNAKDFNRFPIFKFGEMKKIDDKTMAVYMAGPNHIQVMKLVITSSVGNDGSGTQAVGDDSIIKIPNSISPMLRLDNLINIFRRLLNQQ